VQKSSSNDTGTVATITKSAERNGNKMLHYDY